MSASTNSTNGRQTADDAPRSGHSIPDGDHQAGGATALENCCHEANRFIQERPLTSVMAMFGAGLGAGVAVGCLLSRSTTAARSSMADEISRSIVSSISRVLPESLSGKS